MLRNSPCSLLPGKLLNHPNKIWSVCCVAVLVQKLDLLKKPVRSLLSLHSAHTGPCSVLNNSNLYILLLHLASLTQNPHPGFLNSNSVDSGSFLHAAAEEELDREQRLPFPLACPPDQYSLPCRNTRVSLGFVSTIKSSHVGS